MTSITDFTTRSTAATTVRAELTGAIYCAALGIAAVGYAPICILARKLIGLSVHPGRIIEAYRGGVLCLRTQLTTAARLRVKDGTDGVPRFTRYPEFNGPGHPYKRKNDLTLTAIEATPTLVEAAE